MIFLPDEGTENRGDDGSLTRFVITRLRRSGYQDLDCIGCRVSGTNVTIFGWVETFYLKQVAQEIVSRTPGVSAISNDLKVAPWNSGVASPQSDSLSASVPVLRTENLDSGNTPDYDYDSQRLTHFDWLVDAAMADAAISCRRD